MDLKKLGQAGAEKAKAGMASKRGRVPDDTYTCRLAGASCTPGEGNLAPRLDNGKAVGQLKFTFQWAIESGVKTGDKMAKPFANQ